MRDTKEHILQETFLLLAQSEYSAISLSDIAARVGISKAAIYRHFSNKDALFACLQTHFFNEIADCLRSINHSVFSDFGCVQEKKDLYYRLLHFFAAKPEYLFYVLLSFSAAPDFEGMFIAAMQERGIPLKGERRAHTIEPQKLPRYIHFLYILATSIYFIHEKGLVSPSLDAAIFARHMYDFVFTGWQELETISAERAAILDKKALIHLDELPEENKFFIALSKVIREHGFMGVTVERLSAELGMAKSSLYCYFANKNAMITEFVVGEINHFVQLLKTRYLIAQNTSEAVYIQLQMVLSYLLQRQSIIPLFDWLRSRSTVIRGKLHKIYSENVYLEHMYDCKPALGFEMTNFSISGWISTLPVSIVIQCRFHNFTNEQLFDSVRKLYGYMKNGVK